MKNTIQQVFRSGKFIVGFSIFSCIVLMVIFFPLVVTDPPLAIIGQGTFFPPGIYVSVYDSIEFHPPIHSIWRMPQPSELPAS